MFKNKKINTRWVIFYISFLMLKFIIPSTVFAKEFKGIEYASPAWLDNEHIICVKYISTSRSWLFQFLGNLTDSPTKPVKEEIQIISIKIDGSDEKIIKNIFIDRRDGTYRYKEEIFKGVLRINSFSYLPQKKLIAFDTHGYTKTVFIIKEDSTGVQKIAAAASRPRFSPDGSSLQYTSNGKVWLYDLDTREHKVMIENALGGPWSPDGKKIAFSREVDHQHNVFIYDLETKTEKEAITHLSHVEDWKSNEEFLSGIPLHNPRVSPDRTLIVGEPNSDPKEKVYNYIGITDINGKNLRILRYAPY